MPRMACSQPRTSAFSIFSICFSFPQCLIVFYKCTESGVLLVTELDRNRVDTANTIFELDNAVDLSDLTSRVSTTKQTGVNNIAPLFQKMKISEFTFDFTKACWELNIHFKPGHHKPSFCWPRRTSMQSQSTVAASTFIAESIIWSSSTRYFWLLPRPPLARRRM